MDVKGKKIELENIFNNNLEIINGLIKKMEEMQNQINIVKENNI